MADKCVGSAKGLPRNEEFHQEVVPSRVIEALRHVLIDLVPALEV